MAVLNIRNLPAEVHHRLRLRAAQAHHSMEAEARAILSEVCMRPREGEDPAGLPGMVEDLYGGNPPEGVVDDLIRERRQEEEDL